MRILYLFNSLGVGGTEKLVLSLASRMEQRGHEVALMVLRPPGPNDLITELEVIHLGLNRNPLRVIPALQRASDFIRIFLPDIIHSHNFHGNLLGRVLCLRHRKPRLISTLHNEYEGGWLRMMAYRLTDALSDKTVAVCDAIAQRFISEGAVSPTRCTVIANAIDVHRLVPDPQHRHTVREHMGVHGQFVWIAVGREVKAKDFHNLTTAFNEVWKAEPSARLWIVGPTASAAGEPKRDHDLHEADAFIRRLGSRDDIPALLDAADAFVLSSAWEGMPLSLAEAMAMQKPCVSTNVGGVAQLTGHTALLVPPSDSEALASAMLAVMKTPLDEREAVGLAARARISSQFNMDSRVEEWESLYQTVLV